MSSLDAEPDVLARVRFGPDGLVPVVVQDATSGRVLTHAWMNLESLTRTLATGQTWFWSRSRQELWNKGATSGHTQRVRGLMLDCDGDTILALVDQTGVACHTGRRNCFFRALRGGKLEEIAKVEIDPAALYPGRG